MRKIFSLEVLLEHAQVIYADNPQILDAVENWINMLKSYNLP
jgi:hypothetical protein